MHSRSENVGRLFGLNVSSDETLWRGKLSIVVWSPIENPVVVSEKMLAMRKYGLIQLVLCSLLVLSVPLSGAWGQLAEVEHLHPTGGLLESVVAADGAWAMGQSSAPTDYEMKFVVSPEMELRRNFSESVIPYKESLPIVFR